MELVSYSNSIVITFFTYTVVKAINSLQGTSRENTLVIATILYSAPVSFINMTLIRKSVRVK
jgi:hypothetical protein